MRVHLNVIRLSLCLATAVLVNTGQAHPHNWVAVSTDFILDHQGRLVTVHQRWEFDLIYSMTMLEDMKSEYGYLQAGLDEKSTQIIQNLRSYNYFSSLRLEDNEIALPSPQQYELNVVNSDRGQILILEMDFHLTPPVDVAGHAIYWQVFDPTYYVDMTHGDISHVSMHTKDAIGCAIHLESPNPTESLINYAASLDKNQKDSQGLGEMFAETIVIQCI